MSPHCVLFKHATMALCWSLLVGCMERVSCWLHMNRAYVCIPACVLEFEVVVSVRCSNFIRIIFCPNKLQWRWPYLRLLDVRNGCRVDLERSVCMCVWCLVLRVFSNLKVLLVFDAVWDRNFTFMHYFAVQIHCVSLVLVLHEQRVRLRCCVRAWIWRCQWHLMQYEVLVLPSFAILLSKYTTCRHVVWPLTNSAYVCLLGSCCVCARTRSYYYWLAFDAGSIRS